VGIRNRYCIICQRAKNKKLSPPEHTCFMNWKKGATSMEADAIADGFKQSVELHGLKYNKLIGTYYNVYYISCNTDIPKYMFDT